ncbi:phosphopentomutase [Desulforamulus reducens MI-1]|uniref:Phosphopentomutase n=1 Tax=Desulforamulus reducens (strain ATCC BAA-1160 / DSM 100696 / MI-1) TaxID=349161 RepID=A4J3I2_DESRM|nr:phosphopentomutase [Desulforamulus reducens]ABO49635.1 phosphopentomutase [Desulforamulus reducens MI-1]
MTERKVRRVSLIVLDSVGIGELPDAADYGDKGSNTLANVAKAVQGLNLPNLAKLGLGHIHPLQGVEPMTNPLAAYGKMAERSMGKDTTTGHWELAGIILEKPFRTYPQGFPKEIIDKFENRIGRKILGNVVASGTQIIEELGKQHMDTGCPIVYTSADSVFQIAAHEDVIPLEELYRICEIARQMLDGEHKVGRVIARPFVGKPGSFQRTANRHDYAVPPPVPNILTILQEAGIKTMGVGKIYDIFAGVGISDTIKTKDNMDGVDKTIKFMKDTQEGLIFANLVEYDSLYGHRNDPAGYARALEAFDRRLPEIMEAMLPEEVLIITADHGCDPTTTSTDHSREYVPLLVYGEPVKGGVNLGTRTSFSDVAASLADFFGVNLKTGISFVPEILNNPKD